ncbi:MAG TPA: amino acid adenylation domain-containing protein, partial [Thermoanaerobaculia bacterium]|nr:amino acid adenylation domain-containing protein [Thermoanaerobaculia bacterium]
RSAVALVGWAGEVFSGADLEGVLAATSVCFDLSVFELFVPLALGGTVVLAGSALELGDLAEAGRVRLVNTVPSAMAELLRQGAVPAGVRTVNLAGEALPGPLAEGLYGLGTVERVLNLYGPSEDTTYSTWSWVERGEASPAIGRPVSNTRAYVVDGRGEPLPVGVPGELLLGGAGLARGYLGRPELTAERFVPDPFGEPGGRLYRTGDLARWRRGGELEFLGRRDHQVKVRGFRIELGEIEAALLEQPGVRQAAVLARNGALVGYVAAEPEVEAAALRQALEERLPGYMVPALWVLLSALPQTASGKVDRKALAEVQPQGRTGDGTGRGPRTPTEEVLTGVWSEVLGLDQVEVEASFFELGGHSLLATRVVSRVRGLFGVELGVRSLFESPSVAALARRVDAALRGVIEAVPPLVLVAREAALPLSFGQERLWFLEQLEPGSPLYNMPAAVRLRGVLEPRWVEDALAAVVERHEALRTHFAVGAAGPVQVIDSGSAIRVPLVDLTALAEPARQAEAARLAGEEARRPFDLARGPLVRAALLREAALEHRLLLTLHHIVADGWSLGVLVRELSAAYEAQSRGAEPGLDELPVQYGDFAVWQRQALEGAALEPQVSYWRQRLAGLEPLELPADRPRPAVASWQGASWPAVLPQELWQDLTALARREGATPFMVLAAVYAALLGRWAGCEDVAVGTPVAGRTRSELEGLVGFFVNTLALRVDLSGEPTFAGLLGRVRETALGAYAHQDLPFEKLVEELGVVRSLGQAPLVKVLLALRDEPLELRLPDVAAELLESDTGSAKFDLSLSLGPLPGRISFRADLFDAPTVARFGEQLQTLLGAALSAPERAMSQLPLLDAAAVHQVVHEWSRTPADGEMGPPLHRRFAEWSGRTPDAVAAVHEDESITYRELSRRVGQLAEHLRRLGIEPEEPIGLCLERSLEMATGLLAIHQAGGAYVPLDPTFPPERLAFMLEDAGVRTALTQSHLLSALPAQGLRTVCLDSGWKEMPPPQVAAGGDLEGSGLAYVIYTSGSTGRPKGVAVEHRQLASYVDAVLQRLDLPPGCSFATVSTLAADLGNTVVFASFAIGGCLHIVSRERTQDAEALSAYFGERRIDCLKIVPSHLAALLTAPSPERLLPRRRLVLGGEASSWDLVDEVRALAPDCTVLNHYGPTETTVGIATHRVGTERLRSRSASVPLGRPLAGTAIHLLDPALQPAPPGVPGELYAGGANVSRGYFGQPGATAERFIPDPFGGEPGGRLYRTGDLAVRWPDGTLEFLGRIDQQVKVRGFRVEPGEIEAALRAHPAVAEAVVLVRREPRESGENRLTAFVAARSAGLRADELQAELARRLPAHMVPSEIGFVDGIPLTANGKVDRAALLALPVAAGGRLESAWGLPRTPLEELLAGLWAEVLGREAVGIHDDFFALGGHSLLATRLSSRVRSALRADLPLRALFEGPTVAAMACRIAAARDAGLPAEPPLVPVPRAGFPPLSFSQERLWFLDRLDPASPAYNLAYFCRLEGALDAAALARSLVEIVRQHEVLRTSFPARDGQPVQVVAEKAVFALPRVDLTGLPAGPARAEVDRLAAVEARRPFDLASGPLIRGILLRQGAGEHVLLLALHHIVSDAWSRGVLLAELARLYPAFQAGLATPLPPLAIQYADFAVWQREWLRGGALESQLAFWRQRLGAEPPALDLPTDHPRPAARSSAGGALPVAVAAGLARGTRALALQRQVTPFMLLLAAFQSLLHRYTGQETVLVGSPIANRHRPETEGLIGFFVNTLVFRADLGSGTRFGELLETVRETTLEGYAHQDLPFEKLVEGLGVARALDRTPLVQVLFVLQNAPMPDLEIGDLTLRPLDVHTGTAKLDLTLSLVEERDGFTGTLEYASALFEAATMERLLGHFATLLDGSLADPERAVGELPLLTTAERDQLLVEWNATAAASPVGCLHELFAAQAARTPGAPAILFAGRATSYGELERRSRRLARRLRALGVGPEVRVGVCLERAPDLVVALLGVLRAGGAYVPLDPAYPAERLASMLTDSGAGLVLSGEGSAAALPSHGARVLRLEEEERRGGRGPALPERLDPSHLAYVIYTSGSTGRPKGVAIAHRSAVALVGWAGEVFSGADLEGVLAATSVCFDLSVFELFVPLALGGTVVLAGNALELADLTDAAQVRLVNTVPSAMAELLRQGAVPVGVRTVNLAGEALPGPLAEGLYGLGTVERVLNLYGPSEDTTYSTGTQVSRGGGAPLIGRPLPGTRSY